MATMTEPTHAFAAAREAGREPFKVKDLTLAELGRKEIRLAEQEMPGLMAIRAEYAGRKPLAGAKVMGSLHMTIQTAVLFLVLHYVEDPAAVVAEARRALAPGGRLLIADMTPHDRAEYRQTMGHVWQGFAREQVEGWLRDAGFASTRHLDIPPDPAAKGPSLFAAVGRA